MLNNNIWLRILHRVKGRNTFPLLNQRNISQWDSPEKLKEKQWAKLTTLLKHTVEHVPYYKNLFIESGIDVHRIQSPIDFSQLVPILDKETVRKNLTSLHADNFDRRLTVHRTGGSTGEPLAFPVDRATIANNWANLFLTRSWWGLHMDDRKVMFWGHHNDAVGTQAAMLNLKDSLKRKITNTVVFSAYNMSDLNMQTYADKIKHFRPKVIYGYASALETFARFMQRKNIDLGSFRPNVVIATAEVLQDEQRLLMKEVYGCPVANEYGSCEGGLFAFECPEGGFHIMEDSVYLEVVDEHGQDAEGGIGDILVTQLDNYSVPLIRYRIGDVGQLSQSPCSCGRGWALLESVKGRKYSMLYGINGTRVNSGVMTKLLWDIPGIERYQAIQDSINHIKISIVSSSSIDSKHLGRVRRKIEYMMGEGTAIDFEIVQKIDHERSAKFEFTKSLIVER